ncbi:MAG: hypothetical protein M5R41_00155 [Bacteroidia bacterium]|nr:hypothetical protein [Bacteroidia bacterium]
MTYAVSKRAAAGPVGKRWVPGGCTVASGRQLPVAGRGSVHTALITGLPPHNEGYPVACPCGRSASLRPLNYGVPNYGVLSSDIDIG